MEDWSTDFNKCLTLATALQQFIENATHPDERNEKERKQCEAAAEMLSDVDAAITHLCS